MRFFLSSLDAAPPSPSVATLDPELRSAISFNASNSVEECQRYRSAFLLRWRRRALETGGEPKGPCNVTLLSEMMRYTGIKGMDDLITHLEDGFPMSGVLSYDAIYERGPATTPELSVEELLARQQDVLARTKKAIRSDSRDNKSSVWGSVLKDIAAGHMEELNCPLPSNSVFLRRFVVRQVKADRPGDSPKERACDDGKMAQINRATAVQSKVRLDSIDVFAESARLFVQETVSSRGQTAFCMVGLDHREAYRQLAADNGPLCRAVVAEDLSGAVRFFELKKLSFGESASVVHYNAFAKTLVSIVRIGMKVPLMQYFDDFACPGLLEDERLLGDLLELLEGILGTAFNEEKTARGNRFRHLGLMFSMGSEGIDIFLSEPRKEKLKGLLRQFLDSNSLSPGEASSLAGKLNFATAALYGKVGRIMLQPIYRRSDARSTQPGFSLNSDLRRALLWWFELFEDPHLDFNKFIPTVPPAVEEKRYVLQTDACPKGLGAILATMKGNTLVDIEFFSCPVPMEFGKTDIHLLEFAAVTVSMLHWFEGMRDFLLASWIDNNVSLQSILQGSSRSVELFEPVHWLWGFLARARATVRFERVPGEHNLSDLPSRLKVEWAHHPIRGVLPRRVFPQDALVKRAIRGMRSEQPRADSAAGHR
ncbi:hypothetical protein DIPPA_16048 [Diplonema papillatum]|nr:hypothetical protein DIPPA_19663 [Diplonema papillatum]KAJ9456831.1 hypothetical protein DIPPA_00296 [Diplonema papillatum]KAJ9463139.1 hypothetical protein DIPPA_16048 [Diplonema papillatum]